MSQRDEITRIPLTIVSTQNGARTDDVLVGVLAADLDALERAAAGLLVHPDALERIAKLEAELERMSLAYIAATNPGIDMDEVKRSRASFLDTQETRS